MIQVFKAFASRSTEKLKGQIYDDVIDLENSINSADIDTLKRYEVTIKGKLKLIESEETIALLNEIYEIEDAELNSLGQMLSTS